MTVKKTLLLIGLSLIILNVSGQNETTFKPVKKDFGISMNVSEIIANIQPNVSVKESELFNFKYYLKDRQSIRVTLGFASNSFKLYQEDSITSLPGTLRSIDSTYSQTIFSLGIGMEHHLEGTARLDPYFAANILLTKIGAEKKEAKIIESNSTAQSENTLTNTYKADGGTSFSLQAITGMNYFIAKNLSLGGELGLGYRYSSMGGDNSKTSFASSSSGVDSSNIERGIKRERESGASFFPIGKILFAYYFNF